MAKLKAIRLAFNRGLVSILAEARVDIKRVGLAAKTMTNWMPRVLGPMSIRAGTWYRGETYNNAATRMLPFVFANDDVALIELTPGIMRVWKNDAVITRPSVATAVANGTFTTDLASWTDSDETGGTSAWATGGYLSLTGDGTNAAIRKQTLTIAGGDQNVVHALTVVVERGDCEILVGSTDGGDEYVAETTLYPGQHSLAFTPTGANVYVRFLNREDYPCYVDSIAVAAAGAMTVVTPWTTAAQVNAVRVDQSGDILFASCDGINPQRIERRDNDSWSVVDYKSYDGPFRVMNTKSTHRMTAGALSGSTTLTSTIDFFDAGHIGALFKLFSAGQNVASSLSAQDTYTDTIRVTGVGTSRSFTRTITGTWAGTLTLQRSVGEVGLWEDVATTTINQVVAYNDTFDNQIIYYRIGFKTAEYTSGTAAITIAYAVGSITGIGEVTSITSAKIANMSILTHMGSTASTADWSEGAWSTLRGFPSAVALHGARLWWAGKDKEWATVVDSYSSFDEDYVGDAGPISRSIGTGPVDTIAWLLSLQNLVAGAEGAEWVARSSSLDEPLTPTNFNLKIGDSYGSAPIQAVAIDQRGVFIDSTGGRLIEINNEEGRYASGDLSSLVPDLWANATRIAVQRRPDTRVHIISGGNAYLLVRDSAEEVTCWCLFYTGDATTVVEDVVVLPPLQGESESHVYYVVKRIINGVTKRFLEERAWTSEAEGGVITCLSDASLIYSGASTATITGLGALEGQTVCVWANSDDAGDYIVTGGAITLAAATTYAVIGIPYTATYISTKLAENPEIMTQTGRMDHVGLILSNTHYQGLQYGTDADYLDELPLVEDGATIAAGTIHTRYDADAVEINGSFDTDTRLILKASSPKPCTVLAAVITMSAHEKN